MKLLLFKSKTCGPCKMFEPQVIKASEETGVEYIPVDVEEDDEFYLWKKLTTKELLEKFAIQSSGMLVFLIDEAKENGPMVLFERPCAAANIVRTINDMKKAVK